MRIIADLHIHSKHSRATSTNMTIHSITRFAQIKGLNLVGTGDFTHPKWLSELKEELVEMDDAGLYRPTTAPTIAPEAQVHFMITTEVSTIFPFKGKIKKIHHVILTPSLEVASQINDRLAKWGDLSVDGRPTLNMTAPELVENVMEVSKDNEVFPSHCVPPETFILGGDSIKRITDVKEGDFIFTHKGRARKVTRIFKRNYKGELLRIVPWYWHEGFLLTPEHPVYAIKTYKDCRWMKAPCKPICSAKNECKSRFYENYKSEWIQAKNLEVGDILVYPNIKKTLDVKFLTSSLIKIKINEDFCRLVGYYLANGYVTEDSVCFSFNRREKQYIKDVCRLMHSIFNLSPKFDKRSAVDLIFYSKSLTKFFAKLFYSTDAEKRAWNKCMPHWMLFLPKKKLIELFRGWWRGDRDSSSSEVLFHQMKLICLRLGMIPVTGRQIKKSLGLKRIGNRTIRALHDHFYFYYLSIFDKNTGRIIQKEEPVRTLLDSRYRHGWTNGDYWYIPIRRIEKVPYNDFVYNLEVEEDNSYLTPYSTVHNCWTPWFSLFGAFSGFDSVDDCYQDMTRHIHALETGLSSDPLMNWRLSSLDRFMLVSNSDSHSPWPHRIGREANVFELKEPSYREIVDAIRKKDPERFKFTIETDPAYGKYHWTGHRLCNVSLPPAEAIKLGNRCPKCGRKLTKGVEQRVEELADRPPEFKPKGAIPFVRLLPLSEIIGAVLGIDQIASKKIWEIYNAIIGKIGDEYTALIDAPKEKLAEATDPMVAEAIIRVREGRIEVVPGYDGVYGKLMIFPEKREVASRKETREQRGLEEFI